MSLRKIKTKNKKRTMTKIGVPGITQLAKTSIDPKCIELTSDVVRPDLVQYTLSGKFGRKVDFRPAKKNIRTAVVTSCSVGRLIVVLIVLAVFHMGLSHYHFRIPVVLLLSQILNSTRVTHARMGNHPPSPPASRRKGTE